MESLDAQPPSEVTHELPDTGAAHVLDDHLPCDGQVGDEERRLRRGGDRTIEPEVVAHDRAGRRGEGHRGVLTALASDPSESESWVEVPDVERNDLAPAKPSVRQERDDRAVTSSPAYGPAASEPRPSGAYSAASFAWAGAPAAPQGSSEACRSGPPTARRWRGPPAGSEPSSRSALAQRGGTGRRGRTQR
jgi:hypothetical protein